MAKQRRLNKGQLRRIKSNQERRLQQVQHDADITDDTALEAAELGVVVSRFGQQAIICTAQEPALRCHIRRTVDSLVCGDNVIWRRFKQRNDDIAGVIEAVQPRQTLLSRPDYYDGLKPVAANVDQILVVSSVLPAFSSQIIDRYLVACEDIGVTPVIILNKADLLQQLPPDEQQEITAALAVYRGIGYRVEMVSALEPESVESIRQLLDQHCSIVVGQSGVGKSSLVNALMPHIQAEVGDVSDNSGLGQHTTTVATRYQVPTGGVLIDSPGIREFALWHLEPERVAWCFIDFRPYLGQCKFRDCKHLDDPECALQEACAAGDLHARRLYNYHRIIESMALKPSRATTRGKKT